jgi:hypothetical protein
VRLRHDRILDPPTDTLTLNAPVVVGGGERTWRRQLLIDYRHKNDLIDTYAEVTFNDIDGHRRTNRWPRATRQPLRGSASTATAQGRRQRDATHGDIGTPTTAPKAATQLAKATTTSDPPYVIRVCLVTGGHS